mmetsp:Transcript_40913/g.47050  ORF Transcript_40913/g.47050 Transcript_40913/m.47050 type:complete len:88 (-) Transcript_40913:406-669(-)
MEENEKKPQKFENPKTLLHLNCRKTAKSQLKKTGSYRFQNFSFPVSRQTLERTDQISDALQKKTVFGLFLLYFSCHNCSVPTIIFWR